jgi:hypothetical protein
MVGWSDGRFRAICERATGEPSEPPAALYSSPQRTNGQGEPHFHYIVMEVAAEGHPSPRPSPPKLSEKYPFTGQSAAFEGKFANACKPAP